MNLLTIILLLMMCLLISNIISHYTPFIPTALIQIILGIILALILKKISFEIEEEWFFLLFVAPILYNDGRYFPREELWKMKWSILGNSLVLVLLTTVGGGYFIHWMIPEIPIAAAFALAAILSPTDPVAVNGIAKRIHIPEKVLNLVRGESLINDASGIVAFNYAIAAVVTGYFSLGGAIINFSYVFVAGAVLGIIFALLFSLIRFILRKEGINDVIFHCLFQILAPFCIYIITEEVHASGVIAVVVAGIVHSLIREKTEIRLAEEQVLTENIWSILLFILNGVVFLLLGLNIPLSMAETIKSPNIGNLKAILYVVLIGTAILGIRFIWSYLYSYYEYKLINKRKGEKPNIKMAFLTTLTGVRGTVTMAGVLSIPLYMDNGDVFPERSLILFLTAGVILFTLIVATIILPILSKQKSENMEDDIDNNLIKAKSKILITAIETIESEINEENEFIAYELINEYKSRNNYLKWNLNIKELSYNQQKIAEVRLKALKAERKYVDKLMTEGEINDNVFAAFQKSFDYREEAFLSNSREDAIYFARKFIRWWRKFSKKYRGKEENKLNNLKLVKDIQVKAFEAAIQFLEEYLNNKDKTYNWKESIVGTVILDYRGGISRLKGVRFRYNEESIEKKEELRIRAMDAERAEIRTMYESGEITREEANELRRYINYNESAVLYKHAE